MTTAIVPLSSDCENRDTYANNPNDIHCEVVTLSHLCTPNLTFANCDYKEIVADIQKQGLQVDCILTDPPYNISRKNNFTTMGRAGIDFGKWDYGFNQSEWIKQCVPLLKNGGSIIIFNDWKNLSYLVEALESSGCVIKDLLRWEKSNPMPRNVNARYVVDFECAIWAVKGKKRWVFNKPQNLPYLKAVFKAPVITGGGGINDFTPRKNL